MPGSLVLFRVSGPIEMAPSGCSLCCVGTMQVGERWKGREFTATPHRRKQARLAFWPSPSLRPLLFMSGNNTRRKCAESPVAFQGGGSWTAEGAALINGRGGEMRVSQFI